MAVSIGFGNISIYIERGAPFINDNTFSSLLFINPTIVMCAISIIGIATNIITINTFVKLGFTDTINISLMTLTVTDLANLTCLLWMAVCYNPSLCSLVCDIVDLKRISYITGGVPRAYFTTVSGYITSVIACERCLCVLRPLQVRMILTKRKLLTIFTCIFIGSLGPYIPIYFTTGLAWVFNTETNRSIVTQSHKDHLYEIDFICFGVVVACNVTTYVVVTIFTSVIVWKLATQSQWRAKKTSDNFQMADRSEEKQDTKKNVLSDRDKRATMTVTLIAGMYITCFFPATILVLAMSLVPEFNQGRLYGNLYEVLWYLSYVIEAICSTVNILVYLKTGTKFKEAFFDLFCRKPNRALKSSALIS